MNTKQLKRLILKLIQKFNKPALPRGMTEFNEWSSRIISNYDLPNNDSTLFSLAVMVMHLPPTTAFEQDEYFGLSVLKAMSNQVVSQVMQDLKAKQQEAAAEAAKAEATAAQQVASDVPVQQ